MQGSQRHRFQAMLCVAVLSAWASCGDAAEQEEPVNPAVTAVYPSLVQIQVVMGAYENGREQKRQGSGSGAIISSDGYVVTNHHVAGHAVALRCRLANREELPATLVGTDPLADIAVIKLDLSARAKEAPPLQVARWGDSGLLKVGDVVYAMGCPLGLSQSVTRGILANADMMSPQGRGEEFMLDGEAVGSLVKWLGHDATIQPGNSGGPLVNERGEIIGVNEIGMGSMGGAIPSAVARPVAEEIVRSGKVRRAFFGISFQPLLFEPGQDRAGKQGVLVAGTVPGTPGAEAGIRPGDVILSVGGETVHVRFQEEMPGLNGLLARKEPGQPVAFRILRDGKEETLQISPVERDEAVSQQRAWRAWGFSARRVTMMDAKGRQRPDCTGLLIATVTPGGPADKAVPPLRGGDILLALSGKAVATQADFERLSTELVQGKTSVPVLVEFERGNEKLLTLVEAGIPEPHPPVAEARKAWMGVSTQVLTRKLAKALGLEGQKGVRVSHVYPKGNAEQAGIQVGDIITHLDGQPVDATEPHHTTVFQTMVHAYRPSAKVEVTLIRGKETKKIAVALNPAPKSESELQVYDDTAFDFTARDMTLNDRVQRRLPDTETGAVLTQVTTGGWGAVSGLRAEDIVKSVNGREVATLADLQAAMKVILEQKPKHVVFFVRRGITTSFVEAFPVWD
jgi:serine protease Do